MDIFWNHTIFKYIFKINTKEKHCKYCFVYQVTIDELQTEVSQILRPNHSSVVSRGHLDADSEGVSEHVFNLTVVVTKLSDDVEQHSRNLAELVCLVLLC